MKCSQNTQKVLSLVSDEPDVPAEAEQCTVTFCSLISLIQTHDTQQTAGKRQKKPPEETMRKKILTAIMLTAVILSAGCSDPRKKAYPMYSDAATEIKEARSLGTAVTETIRMTFPAGTDEASSKTEYRFILGENGEYSAELHISGHLLSIPGQADMFVKDGWNYIRYGGQKIKTPITKEAVRSFFLDYQLVSFPESAAASVSYESSGDITSYIFSFRPEGMSLILAETIKAMSERTNTAIDCKEMTITAEFGKNGKIVRANTKYSLLIFLATGETAEYFYEKDAVYSGIGSTVIEYPADLDQYVQSGS